jgi:4-hydroxy-3-polyprenylbenzoate decarboxylase
MNEPKSQPERIVVAISGASGAAYAQRLIQLLIAQGIETHLVVSPYGQRLLHEELGMEGIDLQTLAGGGDVRGLIHHQYRDVGATIASGSFIHDGMIVIPCSSNTLGSIAQGLASNLIHRAAHVTLKERRPLVLVHREMPLSLIDIRNMATVTEAGGVIAPANPGFYMLPHSAGDLVDFVVARCLDLLKVQHELPMRWGDPQQGQAKPQAAEHDGHA